MGQTLLIKLPMEQLPIKLLLPRIPATLMLVWISISQEGVELTKHVKETSAVLDTLTILKASFMKTTSVLPLNTKLSLKTGTFNLEFKA